MSNDFVKSAPELPGVYLMKGKRGKVLYVGKARVLKNRISQYFQKDVPIKTQKLISKVASIEFITTASETDALMLESNLVKQYSPKYNILLKDDKRFGYIRISTGERFPRISMSRRIEVGNSRFYGPYTDASKSRSTLALLKKLFGLRTCRTLPAKPCLSYHIGRCSAPCLKKTTEAEYGVAVFRALEFLDGNHGPILKSLESEMDAASKACNFEHAALLRDRISAIRESSIPVEVGGESMDVLAIARSGPLVCVEVLSAHGGRISGHEHFFMRDELESPAGSLLSSFVMQYYFNHSLVPPRIIAESMPDKSAELEGWFSLKRQLQVSITIPNSSRESGWVSLAGKNAQLSLEAELLRSSQNEATELAKFLGIKKLHSIEAIDISHLSGTDPVGSLVRFENCSPAKSGYRRFKIKTVRGIDDPAMVAEVVRRHYSKNSLPDLLLIDGGLAQVNSAKETLNSLILSIPVIGLAKQEEKVYLPGNPRPLTPKGGALHLLQRVRDEAHRFAHSYQALLHKKGTLPEQ